MKRFALKTLALNVVAVAFSVSMTGATFADEKDYTFVNDKDAIADLVGIEALEGAKGLTKSEIKDGADDFCTSEMRTGAGLSGCAVTGGCGRRIRGLFDFGALRSSGQMLCWRRTRRRPLCEPTRSDALRNPGHPDHYRLQRL